MQKTVIIWDRCGGDSRGRLAYANPTAGWTRLSYWVMAGMVRSQTLKDLCPPCTNELCHVQTAFFAYKSSPLKLADLSKEDWF